MRQLILDKMPDKKGIVSVEGSDFKYLRQVLRVKSGDMINLRLLDGTLQNSTVAAVDDKSKKILLQICANTSSNASVGSGAQGTVTRGTVTRGVQAEEIQSEVASLSQEYILFQFIPKPQKFEQIVRQATECGVKTIVPVIGEYSEKSSLLALQGNKKDRLEKIIREARQQSGSPVETVVTEAMTLGEALGRYERDVAFVLYERQVDEGTSTAELLKTNPQAKKIGIACGCEGGISPNEIELLTKKGLFIPVHFSVNILRCETAALYGLAAVQVARS
ncbi:MAG: 16S rRNA (uracil(1498)-N(3))-methyltransferase [Treponema sp.]|nr:16S rRNA (uracil(1498)-N(3))-methyltransferase [Treponema sp.]